jgi:serine O-acetyltransferase
MDDSMASTIVRRVRPYQPSRLDRGGPTAEPVARTRYREPLPKGDRDNNPAGLGLWALWREDFVTHDRDWTCPGFWAIAVHRFGNWRMRFSARIVRAPLTLIYRVLSLAVGLFAGITLPYTVRLGRRVRIWHHGGMVLHARSIGDDVHLRHNTTFGVARRGENLDIPVIGDRVDIGCGACVLGDARVGHDSLIGANAVVTRDVPAWSVVVGVPGIVVKSRLSAGHSLGAAGEPSSRPAIGASRFDWEAEPASG